MEELQIVAKQGEITFNLDGLKKELKEIADRYKGAVVTEKMIPVAKRDLADLRKIAKEVEDRRKAIKKEWNAPYTAFETEVKKALEIINEPIDEINKQIKDYEAQQKADKEQYCRELFDENIGDYKEYIEFSDVFRDTWLNKSTTENEIISDISGARVKVTADLDAIKALGSEFESEVIEFYKKTKSLTDAIQRNSQLISAKQLAEKKAQEEIEKKVEEEVERRTEKGIEGLVPKPPVEYFSIFTVRVKTEELSDELEAFLRLNEITDYSIVH